MSDNYPSDVKLDENPDGSVSFATGAVSYTHLDVYKRQMSESIFWKRNSASR